MNAFYLTVGHIKGVGMEAALDRIAVQIAQYVEALPDEYKIEVSLSCFKERRSLAMNDMLHAKIREINGVLGMSNDYLKQELKRRFLPMREMIMSDKRIIRRPISTAILSPLQFAQFCCEIEALMGRYGVYVQFPEYIYSTARDTSCGVCDG